VNSQYPLKKLEGVSLSRPGSNLVRTWGSWQLKEERFALFAETLLPQWGKVLLINTHLHHGLEATPDFLEALERLTVEMELSPKVAGEIKARMHAGSERRAHELGVLLETLKKYEKDYEVVILGGDFNASPQSGLGQTLREAGFRDCWLDARPNDPGLSFDADHNQANHIMQGKFPLTLVVEDLSFSAKVKEALVALARKQEDRRRRIDYLWLRGGALRVSHAELIGLPDKEGFAPSDHFGVCADVELV
jgi:endonuclease/exonuclease/phosphatase family metal-dependent hydrolase